MHVDGCVILEEKSKPSKFQIFLANTLGLRFHIRLIDSHTIVVLCMIKACQWMGEDGSEPFGYLEPARTPIE